MYVRVLKASLDYVELDEIEQTSPKMGKTSTLTIKDNLPLDIQPKAETGFQVQCIRWISADHHYLPTPPPSRSHQKARYHRTQVWLRISEARWLRQIQTDPGRPDLSYLLHCSWEPVDSSVLATLSTRTVQIGHSEQRGQNKLVETGLFLV